MHLLSWAAIISSLVCAAFGVPTVPTTSPDDYRLTARVPANCVRSECRYFVAIQTNEGDSSYLDIYLEGDAAGWVAVGFTTPDRNMPNSDVLGCRRTSDGGGDVTAVDAWNPGYSNQLDENQNGVMDHGGAFTDGRISCTLSRTIAAESGRDHDLNGDFYLLYGTANGREAEGIGRIGPQHEITPLLSNSLVNPTAFTGEVDGINITIVHPPAPTTAPEDYRLIARNPKDCSPSSCDIFIGIQTRQVMNISFLEIYMEAEADGWVALGVSNTASMFSSDVFGCNRGIGDDEMVYAVDTWNPSGQRGNTIDDVAQIDINLFSASFSDGRISCSFSILVEAFNEGTDLDKDRDLYVIWGVGEDAGGPSSFSQHDRTPFISGDSIDFERHNIVRDSGEIRPATLRPRLIRAHGILMLIAWPVLAVTAIFFAAWMKPALPNGEWFQVHRAFMIASIVIAAVGFILIFVASKDNEDPGLVDTTDDSRLAHLIIGVFIMAFHIANPIIAIFRCNPTGKYRWIFNLLHGTCIGLVAELLALANVGIGLALFGRDWSIFEDLTPFYVYLAFLLFFLVMVATMFIFVIISALLSPPEVRAKLVPSILKPVILLFTDLPPEQPPKMEMSATGEQPDVPPERKPPSRDAPIRWIALSVLLAVMVPFIIALIVLVALDNF